MRLPHHIARVVQGERDHRGLCLQRVPKCLGIQRLWDMIDRKRAVGQRSDYIDVSLDRSEASEQSPDPAEATLIGYSGRKLSRCTGPHRRQNDRHLDAKDVTEWCFQHGILPLSELAFKGIQKPPRSLIFLAPCAKCCAQ